MVSFDTLNQKGSRHVIKSKCSCGQLIVLTWEPSAGKMLLVTALEVFGVFHAGSR
jgi:hypothetical protein